MTDDKKNNPAVNYSANSHKSKETEKDVPEKRVEKVVSGEVIQRKPGLGKKFREAFAGDDAQTVGQYLVLDVIIPQTKNLIFDLGREFLSRILFGGVAPRPTSSSPLTSRTNYNNVSRPTTYSSGVRPDISNRARSTHDFQEIVLSDRHEAENVLSELLNLIEDFGAATVSDLYNATGITAEFTDMKWGWTNLSTAQVRQVREGWLLALPRPSVLD